MDWQTPLALIAILAAGHALARHLVRRWSQADRCGGGCGGCQSGADGTRSVPLVSLESPKSKLRDEG
jgi:hypothetical protein